MKATKTHPRHQCPKCKQETGRKRMLRCQLTLTEGETIHWVNCPDHGWTAVGRGICPVGGFKSKA